MRKCVGCQEMKNKKEMMRVLKTSENTFELDVTGKRTEEEPISAVPENVWRKP